MKSKQLTYRPDIDGLRAIAVILVLLFHFELGIPGGFVGVDVFFVISGYLITEVIRKSILGGTFSLSDFYVRRLLRLHPALIVTVGASLLAGFLIMDPASFSTLAESAKYALFASSNLFFWNHQGYFEASAKTLPLLHTWSLAAEWHFYLLWPVIVWASLKISQRFLLGVLCLSILISLAASQWMLTKDASASYFLMPFRVFELAIGALLVMLPAKQTQASSSCMTVAGLTLIVAPAFLLSETSAFPGIYALAPCLGAAACIYSGRSALAGVLRSWPLLKIGVISYSVYLVHWPLLVFYKYFVFRPIGLTDKIILLLLSFILGFILYHLIERQFMRRSTPAKALGLTTIFGTVAIGVIACNIVISHEGILSRVPEANRAFIGDPVQFHIQNYGGYGFTLDPILGDQTGRESGVIGGDSFALQYAYGLDKILKDGNMLLRGEFQHGCILSSKYTRIVNNVPQENCRQTYKRMISKLSGHDQPLIIAQHWAGYQGEIVGADNRRVDTSTETEYKRVLEDILDSMRDDIGDRELFIVGSQPIRLGGSAPQCLMRPSYIMQPCLSMMEYDRSLSSSNFVNQILSNYAESRPRTKFIDPADTLCHLGKCNNFSEGRILYSDSVHLSREGSAVAARAIFDRIGKSLSTAKLEENSDKSGLN